METDAAWKSEKDAYGGIFLMISTPAWKSLLAFPQLPQARRWNHQSGTENGNSNQDHPSALFKNDPRMLAKTDPLGI